ncbi:Uncharacterized protein Adt_23730 [Abeliophyllum distichum]|uniref:CCHC-type domain-containing protein n=1 Tax=Abeliophyllum distichum TaxID=126358 RepID=A0ABD1SC52_9LAMI
MDSASFRPPVLDGTNYNYWKIHMTVYIQALDEKSWHSIIRGYRPPSIIENNIEIEKPCEQWVIADFNNASRNSKALNAIFCFVDANQFRLISYCRIAKEAWEILQIAHEGTSKVKSCKLQMLTTEFENLRMKNNEAFKDFYARLCDISNQAHALGEKYSESKLVRKVLRSLPNRFHSKVTAIEESKDIDDIKIEELVGSLMTCELNLNTRKKEKATGIASWVEEEKDECDESNSDIDIALVTKQFDKFLKRSQNLKSTKNQRSLRNKYSKQNRQNQSNLPRITENRIQCYTCEGYGHIASECANNQKGKFGKKAINVTWSEDEESTDDQSGDEEVSNTQDISFTSCSISDSKLSDLFYERSHERSDIELNVEAVDVREELKQSREVNKQLTIGAARLNDVLSYRRTTNIRHGLGYTQHGEDKEAKKITFVKGITETGFDVSDNVMMSTKSVIND